MFADWVKISLKVGLVAVIMGGLVAVFAGVQVPTINYNVLFSGAGTAFAVLNYWLPVFGTIWNTTLIMLGILVALWAFRIGGIAVRWLFKVNE